MLSLAIALALQAAAAPPDDPPSRRAGAEWSACVKDRIDAEMRSDTPADALVTEAFARCTRQEEAIRAAITAERGEEAARLNLERLRSGGRQLFLAYIERERGTQP